MDMTNVTAGGPQYGLLDVLFGNVPEEPKDGQATDPMMKLIEALGKKVESNTVKQGWTEEETGLGEKAEEYRFVMVPGMYAVSNQGQEVPLDQLKMVPVREASEGSGEPPAKQKAGNQPMGPMPLLAQPVPPEVPAQGALPQETRKPVVLAASRETRQPAQESVARKTPAVEEAPPAQSPELQKLQAKAEQMGLHPKQMEHGQMQEAAARADHGRTSRKQAKAGERITTTEDFLQMKEAPKSQKDLAPREIPQDLRGEAVKPAEKPVQGSQEVKPEPQHGRRLQLAGDEAPSRIKSGAKGALAGGEFASELGGMRAPEGAQVKDVFLKGQRPDEVRTGILGEVASSVGMQAVKGGGEMKLVIHPEHLGELKLKVGAKNGKVEVQVEAENKDVANILKSGKNDLQDALGDQNLSLAKFEVTVKESSNSNAGNDGRGGLANQQFDQQGQGGQGMFERGMQGDAWQQREPDFRSVMDAPVPKTASPQGKASYTAAKGSNRMLDVVA
ncbi:MAG: flagellar hook-length control protein FliK [Bdellovibrionales bacterium]|nr:flagellar hook-length control protein FliK [Bdellovibrionales bacterium]